MPNLDWGVYTTGLTEGDEISSTYEGRHITATAAELITDDGSGVATKGHACVFGLLGIQAVGVCFNTGTTTDLIAIDTEGIWALPVQGEDDGGDRILYPGQPLFINVDTCDISAIRNNATQIPFGYLLTQVGSGEDDAISAVKVHWDPRSHWLEDQEMLYFGDGSGVALEGGDVSIEWNETLLEMLPAVDNSAFNIGNGTLSMDVEIFGNNALYSLLWDASANTLDQTSLIAVADNAHHLIMTETGTHTGQAMGFHLNLTKTAGDITAGGELVGIASDIGLQSEASHVYAFSAYTEVTGGSSDADFSAFRCYMNNLGAAAANVNRYSCAQLEMNSTVTASKDPFLTGNTFIYFYSHGGAATQYFYIPDMLGATWMFRWASPNVAPVAADATGETWTHRIACDVGGLTRYIKLSST